MESPEAGMNPDRCGFRQSASWGGGGVGFKVEELRCCCCYCWGTDLGSAFFFFSWLLMPFCTCKTPLLLTVCVSNSHQKESLFESYTGELKCCQRNVSPLVYRVCVWLQFWLLAELLQSLMEWVCAFLAAVTSLTLALGEKPVPTPAPVSFTTHSQT